MAAKSLLNVRSTFYLSDISALLEQPNRGPNRFPSTPDRVGSVRKRASRPNLVTETPNSATVCALALAGVGLGLVNPLAADGFKERGLVFRRFEPPYISKVTYSTDRTCRRRVWSGRLCKHSWKPGTPGPNFCPDRALRLLVNGDPGPLQGDRPSTHPIGRVVQKASVPRRQKSISSTQGVCRPTHRSSSLGSGLVNYSQKMTEAAMQIAEKKVWAHRS